MTKIAIMQPYFFANLGYFQLIQSSNIFVNLDHVSFMKGSWMTHNFLKNEIKINIPCLGASQNKSCREVYADCTEKWFENFAKTLYIDYGKEPYFCDVMDEILAPWYKEMKLINRWSRDLSEYITISEFNYNSIKLICSYLDIKTAITFTSKGLTKEKREKGLQEIVKIYEGNIYINAIGGMSLYNKPNFKEAGIDLKFIKNKSLFPNTSILDLLFKYSKEEIKQELNNYELV